MQHSATFPSDVATAAQSSSAVLRRSHRERFVEHDFALSKRLAYCGQPVGLSKPFLLLRVLCRILEYSGHGVPWFLIAAIKVTTAIPAESVQFWTNLFYALIVDILVVATTKAVFRRGRPNYATQLSHAKISPDQFSFPSGHASRSVMVAVLFCSRWIYDPVDKCLITFWALSVCVSRAVLGRHYVSDVFAGALLGIVIAALFETFLWLKLDTCLWLLWPVHEYLFI
ncbi:polyisoprenoid diphosphate/phosphate phosphohydrolase PLPP6-like [Paramacrobiotus metropolitanus]|uniref:polyisoprenoid diphosphate/phosphate phosphohydrolase PLPP6-like n=1 Tax=Paramacrobiotus metropolitanus TaxID=2943436 RepID=UPI002445DE6E|nr:polyisoprenoid diphosphate/phosphate phosphohydrolase PLPP6-like [Paramacrobiotus metropolitanus]XP_055345931.1 polyisoprenoid diphosphate/phosphate phosphohydrolase PLPP6-like [Paramacrobiotus metropolitanus]XP_055345932.1 polyisoprenoid diphosphate/phosphate phosphohydrolase PLPP6-like [Paramacrobiotus metropolitanus]